MKKQFFLIIFAMAIVGHNLQAVPHHVLERLGLSHNYLAYNPLALSHLDNKAELLEVFDDKKKDIEVFDKDIEVYGRTRREYAMHLIELEALTTSDEKKLSELCKEYLRFMRYTDPTEEEEIEHLLWMRKNTPNLWGALPTDSKALIPPAAIHYDESEPLRAWLATVVRGGFKLHGGRRY